VGAGEEGLATINGLLNKPPQHRLLVHTAMMYLAAAAGQVRPPARLPL